jgi:hypothetical protein
MDIPFLLDVFVHHEEYDGGVQYAKIKISEERFKWIEEMKRVVIQHKISYIADWDDSPEYFHLNECEDPAVYETPEAEVDCEMIVVCENIFHYKGYIRNTNIRYQTNVISFKYMEELILFRNLPLSEMPKYINDKDYTKREIALQRMKGEKEE